MQQTMPIARRLMYHIFSPNVFIFYAKGWDTSKSINIGHHLAIWTDARKLVRIWLANSRAACLIPLLLRCNWSRLNNELIYGQISNVLIVPSFFALRSRNTLSSLIFLTVISFPGLWGTLHRIIRADGHRLRTSLIRSSYCLVTLEEWYLSESLPPQSNITDFGLELVGKIPGIWSLILGMTALCAYSSLPWLLPR